MDIGFGALRALGILAAEPDPSAASEDEAASEPEPEKWLLFTDGDESTAWLQVLYGLGFANDLDYDKHDFYFVQYQHRGESTPKLVLFGVKRPNYPDEGSDDEDLLGDEGSEDKASSGDEDSESSESEASGTPDIRDTKIEKITDVNVTSTLLQSLQRSDYFQRNLSNSAQIGINVLLSAYNMRPNDMSRELNSLIMEKGEEIQSFIQQNFFAKIQDEPLEEAEQWSHYETIDEERELKEFEDEVFDKLAPYVKVHMPPNRLMTRLEALTMSDEGSKKVIDALREQLRKYTEDGDLKKISSERDALKKEKGVLDGRITKLESDKAKLNTDYKTLQGQLTTSQRENESKQKNIDKLNEDMRKLNEDVSKEATKKREEERAHMEKEAESRRKATEDASAEKERVDREAKAAAAKRKADTEAEAAREAFAFEEQRVENERKKEENTERLAKISETAKTPISGEFTRTKRNQTLVTNIREYLYQTDRDLDTLSSVQPILDELQKGISGNKTETQKQISADLSIIPIADIEKLTNEDLGAALYLILNRLRTYDVFLDEETKTNISNIKFVNEDVNSDTFQILLPDNTSGTNQTKQVLKNMYLFCRYYGVYRYLLTHYNLDKHDDKVGTVNANLKGLITNIKAQKQETVEKFIDHIFDLGITKLNDTRADIDAFFETKLKVKKKGEISNATIKTSQAQFRPDQSISSNKTKHIHGSHAKYTPLPAMETASQNTYQGGFPAHFVPVGLPSAHFSSGYMY
tara:strand:- start:2857 stop:5112 length:2256 start_codon:yes stop_codon:yes gene_type:complete